MDGFVRDVVTIQCRSSDAVGHGVKEVLLSPDGEVRSKSGHFIMDAEAAESIIAEFKSHGVDVVVDIDHATLQTEKPAPAAGWIKDLFYQPGRGLLGLVLWNDKAREMIRAGEYGYISPVLMVRKSDRRAVSLHSAAVTNKPAIPAMERVAASERTGEDDPAESPTPEEWVAQIAGLLRTRGYGLSEGASLEDVLAAVVKALEGGDSQVAASVQANAESPEREVLNKLWKALKAKGVDLPDGTPAIDVLKAALKALEDADETPDENPDETPDEPETTTSASTEVMTLHAELQQAASDLAGMKAREREREVEELVRNQVKRLKLNPKDAVRMAAAYKLAREDPDTFTAIMSTAGDVLPPQGRTAAPDWADSQRHRVIRNATREFKTDGELGKQTTLDAYVALSLRDEGLPGLTEQERVTLG